ncbi:zinc finger protein 345-like isoform X1 [Lates japonicus]|uniref:Zinc finger protein 345-like isoform X1 n=1 Tax=Lates japonicus TaxID=270547 RepID=A0AAD3ND75_LATJO|nr:zinc finger protein 345-like isoform X1 [Lates japonicus]
MIGRRRWKPRRDKTPTLGPKWSQSAPGFCCRVCRPSTAEGSYETRRDALQESQSICKACDSRWTQLTIHSWSDCINCQLWEDLHREQRLKDSQQDLPVEILDDEDPEPPADSQNPKSETEESPMSRRTQDVPLRRPTAAKSAVTLSKQRQFEETCKRLTQQSPACMPVVKVSTYRDP